MATLSVHELTRRYDGDVLALRDVSFTVEDGRVAAIFGPSGCGKTTVLRLIAGLDVPDGGDVQLDGVSIARRPAHRRGLGLMFQELALFPHLTAARNVEFGLRMLNWPWQARERRAADLLDMVGLAGMGQRRIHELSGGERQRVALARTLAPAPEVLLLDEPLGALDEELKVSLRAHVRALLTELRTTAVVVSHDLRDAIAIADDLIVMEDGRVLQSGPLPQVVAAPRSASVARMLGYVTLAAGPIEEGEVTERGVGGVVIPSGVQLTGAGEVLAHPSSLLAVPAGRGLGCGVGGAVAGVRPDGPQQLVEVALGARGSVVVRWEWDLLPPPVGSRVEVAARPETLRFFRLSDGAATPQSPADIRRFAPDVSPDAAAETAPDAAAGGLSTRRRHAFFGLSSDDDEAAADASEER